MYIYYCNGFLFFSVNVIFIKDSRLNLITSLLLYNLSLFSTVIDSIRDSDVFFCNIFGIGKRIHYEFGIYSVLLVIYDLVRS